VKNPLVDKCPDNVVEAEAYVNGCEQMFAASTVSSERDFDLLVGLKQHYSKLKANFGAIGSDLDRHLRIYSEHILATVGHPRVLEGWLNNGTATTRVREVLQVFYNLGVKESKSLSPMRWGLTDERLHKLTDLSFENMSGNQMCDIRFALDELIEFRKGKDNEKFSSKEDNGCCCAGSEDSSGACCSGAKEEASEGQEEGGKGKG